MASAPCPSLHHAKIIIISHQSKLIAEIWPAADYRNAPQHHQAFPGPLGQSHRNKSLQKPRCNGARAAWHGKTGRPGWQDRPYGGARQAVLNERAAQTASHWASTSCGDVKHGNVSLQKWCSRQTATSWREHHTKKTGNSGKHRNSPSQRRHFGTYDLPLGRYSQAAYATVNACHHVFRRH